MKKLSPFPVLALFIVFVSCYSTPDYIPEDMKPREYFQRAQEAVVERQDYETALFYYETFLERYPDDIQRGIEAQYEIAFIHYKQNDPEAEQLFRDLLARYEADGAELLPGWPKVLARKLLQEITNQEAESTESTAEE